MVILLEPLGCLAGSMYARKQWCTKREFFVYVVANLFVAFLIGYIFLPEKCARGGIPCPYVTSGHHILYSIGTHKGYLGPVCFREYVFAGGLTSEIPLALRISFLLGMVYPYIAYSKPLAPGLLQSLILTCTWFIGYMSDAHASVWCLANVAQVVTMYMDPYWFPRIEYEKIKPLMHNIYSGKKIENKIYDYVIVGSGIGGLSCGALLSLAGYKVLVLEQHSTVGGCTHEFKQRGDYFDSGIHYIGGSTMVRNMLSMITSKPGVALAKMGSKEDGFLYDEIDLGEGLVVKYRAGKGEVRKELLKHFPKEKEGIDKYFKRVHEAQESLNALVVLKILPEWMLKFSYVRNLVARKISHACSETATEVVNDCVKDKRLQALLSSGQLIDWNLRPSKASFAVVGAMTNYYLDGGFYPVGGSSKIAERIVPIIQYAGGQVLVHARVKEFVALPNGTVCGVKMQNGDIVKPKYNVISDIGIVNTLNISPDSALGVNGLDKRFPDGNISNGHMTAFINLDGAPEAFDLRPANIHSWTDLHKFDYNPNKMQEAFYSDPFENSEGCLMTLTCPCVKDPRYTVDRPNKSNVLLLTEAKWDWFKGMNLEEIKKSYGEAEVGSHGKRPKEYLDYKKKWEEVFLQRLYKYYPKTEGHVTGIQIGTPITSAHFINAHKGGSYGLAWTPAHFHMELLTRYLSVKSKIPGLFITGESALFGGFAGAMAGGYICALKVLGGLEMLKVFACHETVDAEYEELIRLRPEHKREEPSEMSLLALFTAVIGVMLGGRRIGTRLR